MTHAPQPDPSQGPELASHQALAPVAALLAWINGLLVRLSMLAMVITAAVLTYAVVVRYFFKVPTDWQDDVTVFMLVGATFFSCAYVQSFRGHVGIEAIASILPPAANRVRLLLVDLFSFLFCTFFAWKSWTLCHDAWVDGQTTSSTLAPPLWIPYSMMAAGMTLLALQVFVQLAQRILGDSGPSATSVNAVGAAGRRPSKRRGRETA